ncbi:hypothetical protein GW17_00000143 [Ensete ventricosum]|nr:hypothetical protein GW17_00000143 [Ensete ventricosum]
MLASVSGGRLIRWVQTPPELFGVAPCFLSNGIRGSIVPYLIEINPWRLKISASFPFETLVLLSQFTKLGLMVGKKLSGDDVDVTIRSTFAAEVDSEWIAWIQKHHQHPITEKTSVSGHDIIIKSIQSWKRDLYSMNGNTARKARH